jgi:amidohydrolase
MPARPMRQVLPLALLLAGSAAAADLHQRVQQDSASIEQDVIAWRRDIHQHPELGNRETRTAKLVAQQLKALKLDEIHTGIAHTGVVGILKGGRPGPTVALRADMDALPVEEKSGLPFASKARGEYNGAEVPVMHACGHDAHTAILLGAASVLAGMRAELSGTVAFVFQPAEEGAPEGEEGGASLMLKEGLWKTAHQPAAIFGLHTWPREAGSITWRAGPAMAAADTFAIVVTGRQTHGSQPWGGVDPIIVSAQIMQALQLIPSRQLDVTRAPSVITVGSIHGGVRHNIIPDSVEMRGTIRTFDEGVRKELLMRLERETTGIAAAAGATATVTLGAHNPATSNDPALMRRMLPTLEAAAPGKVAEGPLIMASEDYSLYQRDIPGLFLFLGVNREGVTQEQAAANHSPEYFVNEVALATGVRALSMLALDYLQAE